MSRLPAAALAAATALAALSAVPAPAAAAEDAEKPAAPAAPAAPELDAKTRAVIAAEVEKAKQEIRDEVRAEIQGAQSAAEFLGAVDAGPKLELLELDGYFRVRGQLYDQLGLGRGADASGYYLFPRPLATTPVLGSAPSRSTLAMANLRLRLEPTLNVSERVRVRMQLDVLDNHVLGTSTDRFTYGNPGSPYPVPFYGSNRVPVEDDPTADRPAIQAKRAWAEVETPVGLLAFGRMPSQWGLGILANAGGGLDGDVGDTVDRLQFALPPVQTPVGKLVFVPMLDFDSEGVLAADRILGPGLGQPLDLESGDDGRTFAFKVAREDTEDEIRRKLERNASSLSYGAYYAYRTQRALYPEWFVDGYAVDDPADPSAPAVAPIDKAAYAHYLSIWSRWRSPRWSVEVEAVGVRGNVGDARGDTIVRDVNGDPILDPDDPASVVTIPATGRILVRQWGAVAKVGYDAIPGKLKLGGEFGIASGDDAPGFGNQPHRLPLDENGDPCTRGSRTDPDACLPDYGSIEGPQFGKGGDRSIKNFRFNPAYRVDLVLWRSILGQVTDAWYLRPSITWVVLPGLTLDGALVYSQALSDLSVPSANEVTSGTVTTVTPGKRPLGVEADFVLNYAPGGGFRVFTEVGVLQPLDGLGQGLKRGWMSSVGLAAEF
jgi:uncharacterized protein (TIGR04551 family)